MVRATRRRASGILPEHEGDIRGMFDAIASRYDLLNRLITWNQDLSWRAEAARATGVDDGGVLLDVACGTGDLVFAALEETTVRRAVGIDFSPAMVRIARHKVLRLPVRQRGRAGFLLGNALSLPFPDSSVDAITSGFALRNFASMDRAFGEMSRVLRPGGRAVILEVHRPTDPRARKLYDVYISELVPMIGGFLSDHRAYTYLNESIARFPGQAELLRRLRAAGFARATGKVLGRAGGAQILTAVRGGPP